MNRVAIIDLGTNTFHLLIADINSGTAQILHKEKQSVKIGEGGISFGKIAQPAQERALGTLQGFKQKITSLDVHHIHAFATSAFRNADNGVEFAGEILKTTGIKVQIIDGQQEAQLIYLGVKQALDLGNETSLIMDIGGGSVEFIIADRNSMIGAYSFEIGAQRLMDKFHHNDPITGQEIIQLESYLDQQLKPLSAAIELHHPATLIGSSGTFDTLSHIYSLQHGMVKTESTELPLTLDGFHKIRDEIVLKDRAQRMAIPGMIEMRVDMIVVASSLIKYILDRYGIDLIRVSSCALKEGVLYRISSEARTSSG